MTIDVRRRRQRKLAQRLRCWLNGCEVTSRCFYADVRRGVVRLLDLDSEGNKFIRDGEPAWAEHRGRVKLRRKVAA